MPDRSAVEVGGHSGLDVALAAPCGLPELRTEFFARGRRSPRQAHPAHGVAADIPLPVLRTHRFDLGRPLDIDEVATLAVVANPDLRAARARLGVSRAQAFAGVGMPARSASVSWPADLAALRALPAVPLEPCEMRAARVSL